MKRKVFDWLAAGVTLLISVLGAVILYFTSEDLQKDDLTRYIWMGLFFLVIFMVGFAALQVYLKYSKYEVQRPKNWLVWALIAAVAVFAIGAGAEYLYMQSTETKTSKKSTGSDTKVDVVLLLDSSGSMDSVKDVRNDSIAAFINSLDEHCQLQVMGFAGGLGANDSSDFQTMDDSGKSAAITFMNNLDMIGLTDFDFGAENALNSLTSNPKARQDAKKAVIMVTDAAGAFNGTCQQSYLDAGVQFYTIRLNTYQLDPPQTLMDFVTKTGGFDQSFLTDSNGEIDSDQLLQAFESVFASTSGSKTETTTKTKVSNDLLISTDSVGFWRVILRTAALMAVAVLFGVGYFGSFDRRNALIHCGVGLVISLVAMIDSVLICSILAAALLGTAIVTYQISEGGELDV